MFVEIPGDGQRPHPANRVRAECADLVQVPLSLKLPQENYETAETCEIREIPQYVFSITYVFSAC